MHRYLSFPSSGFDHQFYQQWLTKCRLLIIRLLAWSDIYNFGITAERVWINVTNKILTTKVSMQREIGKEEICDRLKLYAANR